MTGDPYNSGTYHPPLDIIEWECVIEQITLETPVSCAAPPAGMRSGTVPSLAGGSLSAVSGNALSNGPNGRGSTMDELRALHRAADQELADEGGIAPLDDEVNLRNPVPLTDREPDGRVAACWFVIAVATAALAWVGWKALRLLWSVL